MTDERAEGPAVRDTGRRNAVTDPSSLTREALRAATEQWRRDLDAAKGQIDVRLDAMDTATDIRRDNIDHIPADIEKAIGHHEALFNEQLQSVRTSQTTDKEQTALQFAERDIRTEQAALASKQALDAALLAAKELVGQQNTANVEAAAKAEASFTKQIDQTTTLIATLEKALTDRITELKERVDRGEGSTVGVQQATVEQRESFRDRAVGTNMFVGVVGFVLTVLTIYIGTHK